MLHYTSFANVLVKDGVHVNDLQSAHAPCMSEIANLVTSQQVGCCLHMFSEFCFDHKAFIPGIVVANDADAQRCNLLAHQTKRMCSPALIVTNHDATMYPIVTDHTAKVCQGFVL